jgi:ABC-type uncharacterized transport system involved in gliding motility auxiliary subunit
MDAAQLTDTGRILQRNAELVNLRAELISEETFQTLRRELQALASAALSVPFVAAAEGPVSAVAAPAQPRVDSAPAEAAPSGGAAPALTRA